MLHRLHFCYSTLSFCYQSNKIATILSTGCAISSLITPNSCCFAALKRKKSSPLFFPGQKNFVELQTLCQLITMFRCDQNSSARRTRTRTTCLPGERALRHMTGRNIRTSWDQSAVLTTGVFTYWDMWIKKFQGKSYQCFLEQRLILTAPKSLYFNLFKFVRWSVWFQLSSIVRRVIPVWFKKCPIPRKNDTSTSLLAKKKN